MDPRSIELDNGKVLDLGVSWILWPARRVEGLYGLRRAVRGLVRRRAVKGKSLERSSPRTKSLKTMPLERWLRKRMVVKRRPPNTRAPRGV